MGKIAVSVVIARHRRNRASQAEASRRVPKKRKQFVSPADGNVGNLPSFADCVRRLIKSQVPFSALMPAV
jgi:hypothetical protein